MFGLCLWHKLWHPHHMKVSPQGHETEARRRKENTLQCHSSQFYPHGSFSKTNYFKTSLFSKLWPVSLFVSIVFILCAWLGHAVWNICFGCFCCCFWDFKPFHRQMYRCGQNELQRSWWSSCILLKILVITELLPVMTEHVPWQPFTVKCILHFNYLTWTVLRKELCIYRIEGYLFSFYSCIHSVCYREMTWEHWRERLRSSRRCWKTKDLYKVPSTPLLYSRQPPLWLPCRQAVLDRPLKEGKKPWQKRLAIYQHLRVQMTTRLCCLKEMWRL